MSDVKRMSISCAMALLAVQSSFAAGIVQHTAEYRTTGGQAAFARARECADEILAAKEASAGPEELAALLELSRYVEPALRGRCRVFAAARIPSSADGSDKTFAAVFAQQELIRKIDADIAPVLPKLPPRAGLPGADRAEWRRLAVHPTAGDIIAAAEKLLDEKIPDASDALYKEYWTTGNRTNYQRPYFGRTKRLATLTVAESIERKGRFLPALVETIDVLCSMKTWVLPAHDWTDKRGGNFRGTVISVDLVSSKVAAQLAIAVNFLGDELPPATVRKIRDAIERRIFAPLRLTYACTDEKGALVKGKDPLVNWWVDGFNNWNAVCHDNVLVAALVLLDDRRERAFFVARALRGLRYYARLGFVSDGYCQEGIGYWNYGFGHLLMLGLMLRDVTDGKIDVFEEPIYRKAAEYAYGFQLERNISPGFADGNGVEAPSPVNLAFVRRVWPDLTCREAETVSPFGVEGVGYGIDRYTMLLGFGKDPSLPASGQGSENLPLRSAFPVGQVWLMRAGKDLSVAVKGGHNDELHNHNDIGSYYLVSNGRLLSGDPGGEAYTARSFTEHRYESKIVGSYAHPVPVVDGKLQSAGKRFAAKVIETKFTDSCDTVVLDISGAYDVQHLLSLVRAFRFDRSDKTFSVTDAVKFAKPSSFEEVYTTFKGEEFGTPAVSVTVAKGGKTIRRDERIPNPERVEPMRHAIAFECPVTEAEITLTFKAEKP